MNANARWDWRVEGVFLAVWAGLALAIFAIGFRPEADARHRAASAHDDLIAREHERDLVRVQAEDARRRLEKAELLRDQAPVRLEQASQVNQRLSALSALAEGAGVKLDQLEPGKPSAQQRYTTVPVHLAGVASYVGLVELFRRLHDKFPDTRAPRFTLSANLDAPPPVDQTPGKTSQNKTPAPEPTGRFAIDLLWYAAPDGPVRSK